MEIVPLVPIFARHAARLHMAGISLGFLTTLGIRFLTLLYETIATSEFCFSYAAVENGEVLGFVTFTEDLGRLYRRVLIRNKAQMMFVLASQLLSWQKLKGVFQNLFYPAKIKHLGLPTTGLLSIAVDEKARGRGIGSKLIEAGFQECRRRKIDRVRVLAAVAFESADALYRKCGFEEVCRTDNHGVPSRFYVANLTRSKMPV